jgi:GTP cyclohydrolase II
MNIRLAERDLATQFGVFCEILYYDGQRESIALVMGNVCGRDDVLCRVHSHCLGAHVFNSIECTCREEMASAQAMVQQAGEGVIIWLDQDGKGNGHLALVESIKYKKDVGQAEAYVRAGFAADARDYRPAAEILADLGVGSIRLISNSESKAADLRKASIAVSGLVE